MNYSLLIVVCGLAVGMIGLERWASWRLSVARRQKKPAKTCNLAPAAQPETDGGMVMGEA